MNTCENSLCCNRLDCKAGCKGHHTAHRQPGWLHHYNVAVAHSPPSFTCSQAISKFHGRPTGSTADCSARQHLLRAGRCGQCGARSMMRCAAASPRGWLLQGCCTSAFEDSESYRRRGLASRSPTAAARTVPSERVEPQLRCRCPAGRRPPKRRGGSADGGETGKRRGRGARKGRGDAPRMPADSKI